MSCPTLCNPMDHHLPGSSVHGILQARTLVAISFSRGSFQPRNWTCVSCVSYSSRWTFYHCTIWEYYPIIIPSSLNSLPPRFALPQTPKSIFFFFKERPEAFSFSPGPVLNWFTNHYLIYLSHHLLFFLLSPLYRWRNWGSEWWGPWPGHTAVQGHGWISLSDSSGFTFNHHSCVTFRAGSWAPWQACSGHFWSPGQEDMGRPTYPKG